MRRGREVEALHLQPNRKASYLSTLTLKIPMITRQPSYLENSLLSPVRRSASLRTVNAGAHRALGCCSAQGFSTLELFTGSGTLLSTRNSDSHCSCSISVRVHRQAENDEVLWLGLKASEPPTSKDTPAPEVGVLNC